MGIIDKLALPLLRTIDPEKSHCLTIKSIKAGFYPKDNPDSNNNLGINLFNIEFPNPIGIAAGFDKNAEVPSEMLDIGFGFAEVGTVTPKPQQGNNKPRIFRLAEDMAIINRLGFNNKGHKIVLENLTKTKNCNGIIGVNIGANKDSKDRISDYVLGLNYFYNTASYFTVNISSPNTPGLRELQTEESLNRLIDALVKRRIELMKYGRKIPILIKIAPDNTEEQLSIIAQTIKNSDIDGVVISNTTISRPNNLLSKNSQEQGGLSGKPLYSLSNKTIKLFYKLTNGQIPIIGVGGVCSGNDAYNKIKAGASLLQLYTGLIYKGPHLIQEIKKTIKIRLKNDGYNRIQDIIGIESNML